MTLKSVFGKNRVTINLICSDYDGLLARNRLTGYPFYPKSTAYLRPGQFWVFQISNGLYCVGVVVSLGLEFNGKPSKRSFIAGLLDFASAEPPTANLLEGVPLKSVGNAHIKTIQMSGVNIQGEIVPTWDFPEQIVLATFMPVWGYNVIKVEAENYYCLNLKEPEPLDILGVSIPQNRKNF